MSTPSEQIKIIFGAYGFASSSPEEANQFVDVLTRYNVKDLDTARIYEGSEQAIGELGAASKFIIHTKAPGFAPGSLSRDSILQGAETSFTLLKTESVETYFLHCPDKETSIEETVDTIQDLYKQGKFKRFGLSNFDPDDVRKIYDYASSKGYVLPSVYQGNFNPVSRHYEKTLFPLLRELKISFYAYSPLAGGFLTKSPETLGSSSKRWDPSTLVGELYHKIYNRPALMKALTDWQNIAEQTGISKAALAYRWVTHNSILSAEHGDGIIIGASSLEQLKQTLDAIAQGPLEPSVVKRIDDLWETVKHEAPTDNFHG
ncbi:hypothetical protein MMC07_006021 [Pseudocyphellaria aurata]|nr:hypothetical protein [Pseudocyphellaria aurata]